MCLPEFYRKCYQRAFSCFHYKLMRKIMKYTPFFLCVWSFSSFSTRSFWNEIFKDASKTLSVVTWKLIINLFCDNIRKMSMFWVKKLNNWWTGKKRREKFLFFFSVELNCNKWSVSTQSLLISQIFNKKCP